LNAVINESLICDPPGSLINNSSVKDFKLNGKHNSYIIHKGTRIVSNIHALHRNLEAWSQLPQPQVTPLDKFDPTRFLSSANEIIGSDYYMPFGKGLRKCPGQIVGLAMIRIFISCLLIKNPNCQISISKDHPLDSENSHFNIMSHATFKIKTSIEK